MLVAGAFSTEETEEADPFGVLPEDWIPAFSVLEKHRTFLGTTILLPRTRVTKHLDSVQPSF